MYYFFDGTKWYSFYTPNELINHLASGNVTNNSEKLYYPCGNRYFQNMAHTPNDTRGKMYLKNITPITVPRVCYVYDGDGRNIYNHELVDAVLKYTYQDPIPDSETKPSANFRNGPVPYTGKPHGPYRERAVHTQNERRQCAAPQMARFNRAKRGTNLPTMWDVSFIYWEKSWKRQTKCRHQWEKHLKSV